MFPRNGISETVAVDSDWCREWLTSVDTWPWPHLPFCILLLFFCVSFLAFLSISIAMRTQNPVFPIRGFLSRKEWCSHLHLNIKDYKIEWFLQECLLKSKRMKLAGILISGFIEIKWKVLVVFGLLETVSAATSLQPHPTLLLLHIRGRTPKTRIIFWREGPL